MLGWCDRGFALLGRRLCSSLRLSHAGCCLRCVPCHVVELLAECGGLLPGQLEVKVPVEVVEVLEDGAVVLLRERGALRVPAHADLSRVGRTPAPSRSESGPCFGVDVQLTIGGGLKDSMHLLVRIVKQEDGHPRLDVLHVINVIMGKPCTEQTIMYNVKLPT